MIYLIHNTNNNTLKIGKSDNPEKRLKQLLTATPDNLNLLFIIEGEDDHKYKKIYKEFYIKREWYNYADKIIEEFKIIQKNEEIYKHYRIYLKTINYEKRQVIIKYIVKDNTGKILIEKEFNKLLMNELGLKKEMVKSILKDINIGEIYEHCITLSK